MKLRPSLNNLPAMDADRTTHRFAEDRAAQPLSPVDPDLQPSAREILRKGAVNWLKTTEVRDILLHHDDLNVQIAKDPPWQPAGETMETATT